MKLLGKKGASNKMYNIINDYGDNTWLTYPIVVGT
jgi:hypothetical protein